MLSEEIAASERGELHGRVGAAIEKMPDAEEHLVELAYHFGASDERDDAQRALFYARRAGDRALALLAYEEAARLYEMAIGALERAAPLDEPARGELLLSLGEAHKHAGSADDAKRAFLRATNVGRAVGSPSCSPALHSASRRRSSGPRRRSDETRTRLLEEAISTWGNDESALRARVMARLALDLHFWDPLGRTSELCEQAVATARRIGDPSALAFALSVRHEVGRGPDDVHERLAMVTEILRLSSRPEIARWRRRRAPGAAAICWRAATSPASTAPWTLTSVSPRRCASRCGRGTRACSPPTGRCCAAISTKPSARRPRHWRQGNR